MLEYIGCFLVGGLLLSLIAYFDVKGQSFIATFVTQFPSITVLLFIPIYKVGDKTKLLSYTKSLIYSLPPWILYVLTGAFLSELLGVWWHCRSVSHCMLEHTCLVAQIKTHKGRPFFMYRRKYEKVGMVLCDFGVVSSRLVATGGFCYR